MTQEHRASLRLRAERAKAMGKSPMIFPRELLALLDALDEAERIAAFALQCLVSAHLLDAVAKGNEEGKCD